MYLCWGSHSCANDPVRCCCSCCSCCSRTQHNIKFVSSRRCCVCVGIFVPVVLACWMFLLPIMPGRNAIFLTKSFGEKFQIGTCFTVRFRLFGSSLYKLPVIVSVVRLLLAICPRAQCARPVDAQEIQSIILRSFYLLDSIKFCTTSRLALLKPLPISAFCLVSKRPE